MTSIDTETKNLIDFRPRTPVLCPHCGQSNTVSTGTLIKEYTVDAVTFQWLLDNHEIRNPDASNPIVTMAWTEWKTPCFSNGAQADHYGPELFTDIKKISPIDAVF